MSTHPQSEPGDLDRTDELPRLDVAAYEAQLAADSSDKLASTDAWSVEGLREAEDDAPQDTAALRFPRHRGQFADSPKTSDVTLDATRILGRIQQLESELNSAQQRENELQARLDRLTSDLATKEKETRGLSSDNARLSEQRAAALERTRALEQQTRDDAAQFERDLAEQRALRTTEQNAATTARVALEGQLAEVSTLAARLREDNARLDDESHAAAKLAKTQADLVEQFKQRLVEEEKKSAQLARHLASKIAEQATVTHEMARRDATIRGLTDARDDLAVLLESTRNQNATLSTQLEASAHRVAVVEQTLGERDAALAQRDAHIGELETSIRAAEGTIAALTDERDTLQRSLTSERESQAQAQQALTARTLEINQLQGSTDELQNHLLTLQQQLATEQASHSHTLTKVEELERSLHEQRSERERLTSELESSTTRVQALESAAEGAAAAYATLNTRLAELQRSHEELASAQRELDELRTQLVTKHSEVAERDQALRAAQDIVAELRKANDELQERLDQHQKRLVELETRDREREESVLANAADLAAARRQLGQQLAAVQSMEQAIRARDTLAERLRAELQMTQDERAIVLGQLEKSRARNKSMAREIFARDNQIASLKTDLAVHVETLAAIRQDVNRASAPAEAEHPDRILEPVGHDGDIIPLNKKMMTIGRTSENDICIPSKLVSRNHARLLIGPNAVIVEDAGSTNGCLVNDVEVKQHVMREGDVLSIGDLKYRLRTRSDSGTRIRDNVIPFADGRHND